MYSAGLDISTTFLLLTSLSLEVKERKSLVSDSLRAHGLKLTRLLHPRDFPGKSTGVCCHFLLQGILPTQGSNPGLLPCRQTLYRLSHLPLNVHVSLSSVWLCIIFLKDLTAFSTISVHILSPLTAWIDLFLFWVPTKPFYHNPWVCVCICVHVCIWASLLDAKSLGSCTRSDPWVADTLEISEEGRKRVMGHGFKLKCSNPSRIFSQYSEIFNGFFQDLLN